MFNRIAQLVGIGRNTLVKDDGEVQRMQISQGQTGSDGAESITDDVPVITFFGFSSNAPAKSEVILVRLAGDRSQSLAVGSSHRPSRPKDLQPGDAMLYDVRGAQIWLKDGVIQIDAAGGDVTVQNADTVTVKAETKVRLETPKLEVTGDIVSRADGTPVSLNGLRDAYQAHKHSGVAIGSALSGTTDHSV